MFNQFKTSKLITKLAEICFLQKFIHTSAEGVYSAHINVLMFKQSYFEDVYETKFHFSVSIKINIVYELNQPKLLWQRDQIIRWILAPTSHIIWCPSPLLHTHTHHTYLQYFCPALWPWTLVAIMPLLDHENVVHSMFPIWNLTVSWQLSKRKKYQQ